MKHHPPVTFSFDLTGSESPAPETHAQLIIAGQGAQDIVPTSTLPTTTNCGRLLLCTDFGESSCERSAYAHHEWQADNDRCVRALPLAAATMPATVSSLHDDPTRIVEAKAISGAKIVANCAVGARFSIYDGRHSVDLHL